MAKRFFYVCAGLLCLALAYHFGAQSATAQGPGNPIVGIAGQNGHWAVILYNGDVRFSGDNASSWTTRSNIFSGPTPATQETWGGVKARYRQPGAAAPQDK